MYELNLDKSKKYLLACSFGPDSMALFHILRINGFSFECAIVNYHLRKESTKEVEGLLDYASKYNVKVHVLDDKPNVKTNIEAHCRSVRYKFFKKLSDKNGYEAVLTAHHQDDHIETYLMQKERQNCPIYYGIKENSEIFGVKVVRPLLCYSKSDLQKICDENHVPYAIDKTNFDTSILRNKIRHEVVAKLSKKDRNELLERIEMENDELKALIDSIDYNRFHDVNYLKEMDETKLRYALNILAKNVRRDTSLSKENVGEIKKALFSDKPNVFFKIKAGLYFVKEYVFVDIVKDENVDYNYSYVLSEPGILDTPFFHLDFSKSSDSRNVKRSDYPLTIRNVNPTDEFIINGYKVLARRLLIDWKVPMRLRKKWPVILDKNDTPIYIPRYQKDFVPNDNTNFVVKL